MSLKDRFLDGLASALTKRGYNLEDPNTPLGEALLGGLGMRSAAGIDVSPESAMRSTAVLACVRVIAETLASLPLDSFRRLDAGGKEKARDHYSYSLLHSRPNPYMTSFTFRETLVAHVLLWGNAYAYMVLDGRGGVRELWPLPPWNTKPRIDPVKGRVYDTTVSGTQNTIPGELVLHVPGLGFSGLEGKSVIKWASDSIGRDLALDQYSGAFFNRGASPSGILSKEGNLSEPAQKRLAAQFEQNAAGLGNAFRTLVLEEGLKWTQTQVNPEDAQLVDVKRFSVSDIARIFRVPLMLIQFDQSTTTYASAEQFMLSFVMHTIRPWAVRFEQAINASIFSASESRVYFAEFNLDGLLRGDFKTRQEGLRIMRDSGVINADEWREKENMNPIGGKEGTTYIAPLNMAPAGSNTEPAKEETK